VVLDRRLSTAYKRSKTAVYGRDAGGRVILRIGERAFGLRMRGDDSWAWVVVVLVLVLVAWHARMLGSDELPALALLA
jgi:hypothetical protein